MTSTTVVTNSAPGQAGAASTKPRSTTRDEEELSALPELFAFADLFAQVTAQETPAEPTAAPADDGTATDVPPPDSSALQMAATHSAWFGGDSAAGTATDLPMRSRQPVMFLRDADGGAAKEPGSLGNIQPGVSPAAADGLDPVAMAASGSGQPTPAGFAAQIAAASGQGSAPVGPQSTDPDPASADSLIYAAAMLRSDRARNTQTQGAQTRTSPAGSPQQPATAGQGASAKVQASLSALQAVLSGTSAASDATVDQSTSPVDGAASDLRKAMKDAGVTSVRQETYFAPVLQTPAQQIAQRITDDLQQSARLDPTANPMPDTKMPVRVLQLQLDPPQLGPMTIRISMQDDALRLQLQTSNHDTARLIHHDKEGLSRMLQAAGYTLDGLNIQVTPPDRGAGGQPSQTGYGSGQTPDQQQGWRQPQSEGRQGDRGFRDDPQPEARTPGGQDRGLTQTQTGRTRGVFL